jgi:hypothetical protein
MKMINILLIALCLVLTSPKLKNGHPKPLVLESKVTNNCLTYFWELDRIQLTPCSDLTDNQKLKLEGNTLKSLDGTKNICPQLNDMENKTVAFDVDNCKDNWNIVKLGDYVRLQVKDKFGKLMCVSAASMTDVVASPCTDESEDQLFKRI